MCLFHPSAKAHAPGRQHLPENLPSVRSGSPAASPSMTVTASCSSVGGAATGWTSRRARPATVSSSSSSSSLSSSYSSSSTSKQHLRGTTTASGCHKRIVVQHNYHDHSQDPPPPTTAPPSSGANANSGSSGSNAAFPIRLHAMLTHAEEEGIAHIVSFAPHGRAVQIHDAEAFKQLLPRYFTLSKIASFQRQLNLYGFNRLTRGADRGCYYHELFLRGMPWLIHRMTRVKVKGTGVRARSNPDQEPDFYAMPWVGTGTGSSNSGGRRPPTPSSSDEEGANASAFVATSPVTSVGRLLVETETVVAKAEPCITNPAAVVSPTGFRSMSAAPVVPLPPWHSASSCSVVSLTAQSQSSTGTDGSRHGSNSSSTTNSSSGGSESSDGTEGSGPEDGHEEMDLEDSEEEDGDCVLSGWGMPFHYLGSLHHAPVNLRAGMTQCRPLPPPGTLAVLATLPGDGLPAAAYNSTVNAANYCGAEVYGDADVEDRELEQALHVLLGDDSGLEDPEPSCGNSTLALVQHFPLHF